MRYIRTHQTKKEPRMSQDTQGQSFRSEVSREAPAPEFMVSVLFLESEFLRAVDKSRVFFTRALKKQKNHLFSKYWQHDSGNLNFSHPLKLHGFSAHRCFWGEAIRPYFKKDSQDSDFKDQNLICCLMIRPTGIAPCGAATDRPAQSPASLPRPARREFPHRDRAALWS